MRAAAVIALALMLAGCGQRPADTAQQARDAARVFLVACAQDKPLAVTDLLTEPAREEFLRAPSTVAGCAAVTNLTVRGAPDAAVRRALRGAQVTITHLHAIYAVAQLAAPGGVRGGLQLDDVGGDWQIAGGID